MISLLKFFFNTLLMFVNVCVCILSLTYKNLFTLLGQSFFPFLPTCLPLSLSGADEPGDSDAASCMPVTTVMTAASPGAQAAGTARNVCVHVS